MFLQGLGETITDLLTVNPEYADLPSASSILDASNYTFQALTYGKDADGFNYHAHMVTSVEFIDSNPSNNASSYNAGRFVAESYTSGTPLYYASYNVSAVQRLGVTVSSIYYDSDGEQQPLRKGEVYGQPFSSIYSSIPNYPHISDTRLERGSTAPREVSSFSATPPDLGHYINSWLNPDLSSIWNVLGGFAPPSGAEVDWYFSSIGRANAYWSGTISGMYNYYKLVDKNGYVTFNPTRNLLDGNVGANIHKGITIFSSVLAGPGTGQVGVAAVPQRGDATVFALFGGIQHIGLYCLDLKSMLSSGLMPPYGWNALNNNRKYKLVAKVTYFDNLILHNDYTDNSGLQLLNTGGDVTILGSPISLLNNKGPTIALSLNFT